MHSQWGVAGQEATEHIEPVDGKIEKDHVLHSIEFSSRDPVVVPVHGHLHTLHLADQALGNRPPHKAKVRCPPPILIHGQFTVVCFGN